MVLLEVLPLATSAQTSDVSEAAELDDFARECSLEEADDGASGRRARECSLVEADNGALGRRVLDLPMSRVLLIRVRFPVVVGEN